jgi:hypothetical protein
MIRLPKILIKRKCRRCKTVVEFYVQADDWDLYKTGDYFVEDVFWYLTPDQREILLSRLCGDCFDAIFSEDK